MKRRLGLNALRTFRLVVDSGGFTAAARRSHRVVSSVSRQIAALKHARSQPLFHRHRRAAELRLTDTFVDSVKAAGEITFRVG